MPESGAATSNVEQTAQQARKRTELLIGCTAIVAVVFSLQFAAPGLCCGDYDGYYHAGYARLLADDISHGDFPPSFPWLPLTVLNAHDFADQHFLYHVLLIPFVTLGAITGAKIATALFTCTALFALYWLMLRLDVQQPLLWLFAVFGSSIVFLQRLSLTRANGLSLLLLTLGIWLLLERRYRWLALIALVYVWTYNLFVLLLLAGVCWTGAVLLTDRRVEWRHLAWIVGAIGAGLVLNPFFPHDIGLLLVHLRMQARPLMNAGTEWYPLGTWAFLARNAGAVLSTGLGLVSFGYALGQLHREGRDITRMWFFLLFSLCLLLMALKSRRWLEYWPPYAVLFAAVTLSPLLARASQAENGLIFQHRKRLFWLSAILIALLAAGTWQRAYHHQRLEQNAASDVEFVAAAEWMARHIAPGERVFNVNWATFPKLFYYDRNHAYVAGLDPNYLYLRNPDLWQLYDRISNGQEEETSRAIRERFGANYVFIEISSQGFRPLLARLEHDGAVPLYRSPHCLIVRLR